jgi:hypothetical protein
MAFFASSKKPKHFCATIDSFLGKKNHNHENWKMENGKRKKWKMQSRKFIILKNPE